MTTANDPAEALRALGFRASAEALRALLAHATKSKMSPAEVCLELGRSLLGSLLERPRNVPRALRYTHCWPGEPDRR